MAAPRILPLTILLAVALAAACEDMPAGPDGLDALAAQADRAGSAGLSLRDLFAAAVFRVQRDEGTDSAVAVLGRWRDASDVDGDVPRVREIEAATVVRAFGEDVVQQAAAVLAGEVRDVDLAAARALASGRGLDPDSVRVALAGAEAGIFRARALAARSPTEALLVLDDAAARVSDLRVRLVEARGLPTLDALYARALAEAGERAQAARDHEAGLLAAADSARVAGGLDTRYEAQAALRRHRARIAVEVLGADVGVTMLADLRRELERVRPVLDSLDRAGVDVARDRRMAEAAASIAERAAGAIGTDDPVRALDLAAHAAGLVDELRRRRVR